MSAKKFVFKRKDAAPAVVKREGSDHKCSWIGGQINIPLFLAGACGNPDAVVRRVMLRDFEELDRHFFSAVAAIIRHNPTLDWDWASLRDYIIKPNEAHIRKACDIKSDEIWNRFVEDGYVFLNNWFNEDETEEDPDTLEEYNLTKYPNQDSVFDELDVEY